MKGLFLDDERQPDEVEWIKEIQKQEAFKNIEWTIFKNASDFIDFVEKDSLDFDLLSMDFDLGRSGRNGLYALRFAINGFNRVKKFPAHMRAHSGDYRMRSVMQEIMNDSKEFPGYLN